MGKPFDQIANEITEARERVGGEGTEGASDRDLYLACFGWQVDQWGKLIKDLGDVILRSNGHAPRTGWGRVKPVAEKGGWPVALGTIVYLLVTGGG